MAEYTTVQIAMLTERSERTVQRWLKEGVLKARQIRGNQWEVHESDLEKFLPRKVSEHLSEKIDALEMKLEAISYRLNSMAERLDAIERLVQERPATLRPARLEYVHKSTSASSPS